MSDENKQTASQKKKRSPIELAIVWGLILFLGVAVVLEYRGMTGYQQTLTAMEDRLDAYRLDTTKTFNLSDAKSVATMGASFSEPAERNGVPECKVSWFTFLSFLPNRDYSIFIGLNDKTEDAGINSITTATDRALEDAALSGG